MTDGPDTSDQPSSTHVPATRPVGIPADRFDAIVFDMDGVITDTARVHRAAWRRLFDDLLAGLDPQADVDRRPFTDEDYLLHVDGRSRIDGIGAFLESRRISLPMGRPDDDLSSTTMWGLANRKNEHFHQALAAEGPAPYPSSIALARTAHDLGMRTAVVTASRNRETVLTAAGIVDLFDAHVDGVVAAELGLPGKPDPATFLEAVDRLGVEPGRAVIIEDALAGVEAGARGGFGMVVGVDRSGEHHAAFLSRGAHAVVDDLSALAIVVPEHTDE